MKKYTVKDVIKMEDKRWQLYKIANNRDIDEFSMPLMMLGSFGLALSTTSSSISQTNPLIPLILGAAVAIYGYGSVFSCFASDFVEKKLYDKIENIYEVMGPEFKQNVEKERQKLETEKKGRSR